MDRGLVPEQQITNFEHKEGEEPVNGRGIFQNPVQDEEEPGHVPIADIMKHNQLEMSQQQSGQRPPSKKAQK